MQSPHFRGNPTAVSFNVLPDPLQSAGCTTYANGIDLHYDYSSYETVRVTPYDYAVRTANCQTDSSPATAAVREYEESYLDTTNAHQARGGNGGTGAASPNTQLVSSKQQNV